MLIFSEESIADTDTLSKNIVDKFTDTFASISWHCNVLNSIPIASFLHTSWWLKTIFVMTVKHDTNYKTHKVYCKATAFTSSQNVSQSFLGSHNLTYQFDARENTIISKCSLLSLDRKGANTRPPVGKKSFNGICWLRTARARKPPATYGRPANCHGKLTAAGLQTWSRPESSPCYMRPPLLHDTHVGVDTGWWNRHWHHAWLVHWLNAHAPSVIRPCLSQCIGNLV